MDRSTSNMWPMDPLAVEEEEEEAAVVEKLKATRANIAALVASSAELKRSLGGVDDRLSLSLETLDAASDAITPLQSQSIAAKALHSRINRAVAPALSVLHSFSLVESLQRRLLALSSNPATNRTNLSRLLKYVDCVDRLNVAIGTVTEGCEPAVMKLQEAVEFLNRTKATDQLRLRRLRETLAAIKALYETEVDALRYEGMLDDGRHGFLLPVLLDEAQRRTKPAFLGYQPAMGQAFAGERDESGGGLGSSLALPVMQCSNLFPYEEELLVVPGERRESKMHVVSSFPLVFSFSVVFSSFPVVPSFSGDTEEPGYVGDGFVEAGGIALYEVEEFGEGNPKKRAEAAVLCVAVLGEEGESFFNDLLGVGHYAASGALVEVEAGGEAEERGQLLGLGSQCQPLLLAETHREGPFQHPTGQLPRLRKERLHGVSVHHLPSY